MANTFIGGSHTHYHQSNLALESKEPFTARIEPTVIDVIKKKAEQKGVSASRYAGDIIKQYFELEPHLKTLQAILDKIVP